MTIPIITEDTGEYRVGRKAGSPNSTSAERDAAIAVAAEYAIAEVHKRYPLNHTSEYLTRLIKDAMK